MIYHFQFSADERGGYYGKCIELEGCRSEGDTLEELKTNFKDALDLYLDEPDYNTAFPLPDSGNKSSENILEIEADPDLAFANYLKYLRLQHQMTQKDVADKLGYQSIFGYRRLERGHNSIKLNTLARLKKIFPDMQVDKVLV
jgi:predicted RNase H-like HicB family nuclease/DNA-binding XRE family transcriptional regulator